MAVSTRPNGRGRGGERRGHGPEANALATRARERRPGAHPLLQVAAPPHSFLPGSVQGFARIVRHNDRPRSCGFDDAALAAHHEEGRDDSLGCSRPVRVESARRGGLGAADLGRDRPRPQRPGLSAGLSAHRQSARRRGPHPGRLRPGLPLACTGSSPARSRAGCTASPRTSSWTRPAGSRRSASTAWPRARRTGCPATRPLPSEQLADADLDHDVAAALASLPPEFRAAVVLCDIEGLSYEEIAAVLDVKIGTIRSRIHRGRAQLRAALAHRRPTADRERYLGVDVEGALVS